MFVYFEAINFDATIFDTSDLATMRGGSMAMDRMPDNAKAFLRGRFGETAICDFGSGASKCLLRFDGQDSETLDAAARDFANTPECAPICLTYGVGDSPEQAKSNSVVRAGSLWSMPLPAFEPDITEACPLDRTRQATTDDVDAEGNNRKISAHAAARRAIGRTGQTSRPVLFNQSALQPAQSFEHICGAPDSLLDLLRARAPVVCGKLAVISIDGIAGSKLAKLVNGKSVDGQKERMPGLAKSFYDAIAADVLAWLQQRGLFYELHRRGQDPERVARMDVLKWAGDDMLFFLPAYAAVPFVRHFLKAIDREFDPQENPGVKFHHRIGIVTAQQKVPVRQLVEVADWAQYAGKSGPPDCSVVSMVALESAAPPHQSLAPYWEGLYGEGHDPAMEVFTAREFGAFADICADVANASEAAPLSMTQVNRVLQELGAPKMQLVPSSVSEQEALANKARKLLEDHAQRVHYAAFDPNGRIEALGRRSLPMLLAQISQVAPYALAGTLFEAGSA